MTTTIIIIMMMITTTMIVIIMINLMFILSAPNYKPPSAEYKNRFKCGKNDSIYL